MKKADGFKWVDLSNVAKNVLERCWFSATQDVITKFECSLGDKMYEEHEVITEDVLQEILEYQKYNPFFNFKVSPSGQRIFVEGVYLESEMKALNDSLTISSSKDELGVGDLVYGRTSDAINAIWVARVAKVLKNDYVLDSGVRIPKSKLSKDHKQHIIKKSSYVQIFYSRETVFLKEMYHRNDLISQFDSLFDARSISFEKLTKLISLLEEE